eukprot:2313017-Pleurochrysis_carterae.AAC.1
MTAKTSVGAHDRSVQPNACKIQTDNQQTLYEAADHATNNTSSTEGQRMCASTGKVFNKALLACIGKGNWPHSQILPKRADSYRGVRGCAGAALVVESELFVPFGRCGCCRLPRSPPPRNGLLAGHDGWACCKIQSNGRGLGCEAVQLACSLPRSPRAGKAENLIQQVAIDT